MAPKPQRPYPMNYRYYMHIPGKQPGSVILHITRHQGMEPKKRGPFQATDATGKAHRHFLVEYNDPKNKAITIFHDEPKARGLGKIRIITEDIDPSGGKGIPKYMDLGGGKGIPEGEEGLPLFTGGRTEPGTRMQILKAAAAHIARTVNLTDAERGKLLRNLNREAKDTWGHIKPPF